MEIKTTERGFGIVQFKDKYAHACSLQKSSSARENAIWFGVDDAEPKRMGKNGWESYPIPLDVMLYTRMHLSQKQVKELLPILQKFAETGDL
jgi:hypothetical protein